MGHRPSLRILLPFVEPHPPAFLPWPLGPIVLSHPPAGRRYRGASLPFPSNGFSVHNLQCVNHRGPWRPSLQRARRGRRRAFRGWSSSTPALDLYAPSLPAALHLCHFAPHVVLPTTPIHEPIRQLVSITSGITSGPQTDKRSDVRERWKWKWKRAGGSPEVGRTDGGERYSPIYLAHRRADSAVLHTGAGEGLPAGGGATRYRIQDAQGTGNLGARLR